MRLLNLAVCTAFLAALLAPSLAPANELLRIYDLAAQNDTTLRAAAGARQSVVETAPQARGALLPQVNGTGNMYQGSSTTNNNDGFGDIDSDSDSHELRLTLRQAVFDTAAWNRWQQADANAAAAEANYRIAEQSLVVRVAEAYFNVLAAADNVRFADAEKKAVERQLELAKKRFEVGLSAITDVQEAQARYDLTVAQMIEAEQALSSAEIAVSEITGATDARIVALKDEIPLLGPNPDSVNEWLKTAAEKSLEIRLARAQTDAAKQAIEVARAGHYPTLNLVGARAIGAQTIVFPGGSGSIDQDYDRLFYGLELNVPIFAGGSTQAGVNTANSVHEQRLAELEGRRRAVERSTRNAY
ncbi:MAG: TolC family outer membrane protein, partial [Hydrocarboniphaga effusa]|nr:TolC family outer membrane protein [Hydrocarboniphaga effusa]